MIEYFNCKVCNFLTSDHDEAMFCSKCKTYFCSECISNYKLEWENEEDEILKTCPICLKRINGDDKE